MRLGLGLRSRFGMRVRVSVEVRVRVKVRVRVRVTSPSAAPRNTSERGTRIDHGTEPKRLKEVACTWRGRRVGVELACARQVWRWWCALAPPERKAEDEDEREGEGAA